MSELKFKIPTEEVELPSKGLLYPKDNPLSSGIVEMKYMTAREEDILTNQNYIANGTALDKLLESMIISDINIDDLLIGDKDALLIATRIIGYGQDYTFKTFSGGKVVSKTIDLTKLQEKELVQDTIIKEGENNFDFTLPKTGTPITFKILTFKDEKDIIKEIDSIKKTYPEQTPPELTTRLKYMLTSVDGHTDTKSIREFVDKYFLSADSKAFRKEYKRVAPGVDFTYKNDGEEDINVPINLNFFWPREES